MEILSEKNRSEANWINNKLADKNFSKGLEIRAFETANEIGFIVEVPPIVTPENESYIMVLKEEFKDTPKAFSQVVDSINDELEELLKVFKQEFLKIISKGETEGQVMSIKLYFV